MDFIMVYKTPIMDFLKLYFSKSTYKVYLELFSKAWSKNADPEYYGGVKQIVENTGLSRQAVYKALNFLNKNYYEERVPRRGYIYKPVEVWTEEEVEKIKKEKNEEIVKKNPSIDVDVFFKKKLRIWPGKLKNKPNVLSPIEKFFDWEFHNYSCISVRRPRSYKGGFIKISVEVFEKLKDLNPTEAKIYFYILFENNQRNKSWKKFSLNYLAKYFKINRRRIKRILKKLEEAELLDRKRSIRKDNRPATTEITAITGVEVIEKKVWEKPVIESVKLTEEEAERFISGVMADAEVLSFFESKKVTPVGVL